MIYYIWAGLRSHRLRRAVCKKITSIRKEKKLTQEEVCTELDMDKPYLSSIENGRQNPTLLTPKKLADAIDVETKDFLDI
ncbi:helix-turn-helix transcriptional regulator [Flavivirga abyssicola]|uniref:helix-turn-helix domain-containing protein n=1 Tax=Flavivirga abyssicola TaxID=3063533 RepID=UPI0026DF9F35|nr:helix-turn-helix transcriptional regulator [Flavivirga sp. MEBiC07777]WVK14518.1 helix-turn-helix transcriptional regulator [Flavivirga sp. MEBiC07777]